jgi:hypothetical protein
MQDIEQAEKAIAECIKALQKVRDRLGRARKQVESGKQTISALTSLARDLRGIQPRAPLPDLGDLAERVAEEARKRAERGERTFVEELRGLCESAGVSMGRAGDAVTVGPFLLLVNWGKGVASVQFGKVEAGGGLALLPQQVLARVKELSSTLLAVPPASALPPLAKEFEEAMRVCVARRGGSLVGELRAELPALYREMALMRLGEGFSGNRRSGQYSMVRFIVELKTLVQSEFNTSRSRRFRLETAVIENTRNAKKSVFVPSDLNKGFGEGTYFQAIILTGGA